MCKVVEDVAVRYAERYAQRKCAMLQAENAKRMLRRDPSSLEEVAECLDMPIEKVEKIAREMERKQPEKTDH